MISNRDFTDIEMLVEFFCCWEVISQLILQLRHIKPNQFVPRLTLFAQCYCGKQKIIFQI